MDLITIVYAKTRAKAKHATVASANEAGYEISYRDIQYARRAKDMDGKMVGTLKPNVCYTRESIIFIKEQENE